MASLKSQVSCRDERFLSYLAVCIATLIFLQLWIFERKWLQDGRPRDPFQEIYGSSDVVHSPNANAVEIRAATELQGMRQRVRASLLCSSSNYSFPAMMAEVACLRNALSLPDKENCGSSVPWNISTAISKLENLRQETVLLKERLAMLTKSLSERRALTDAERKEAVGSNQQEKMEKLQLVEAHTREIAEMRAKLVAATSFRRLKDSHEPGLTESSHNWFMSSVDGESKDGLPESFDFPADDVHKRLLCLKGNHTFDGSQNFYAFAWKEFLPTSAVLLPGLTFVADNYWDYNNPWHSMSALVYFIFWRSRNGCAVPKRLVLYHWGEVVTDMGPWIGDIMRASLGVDVDVGTMGTSENRPVCFERAVVNRRGLGGMSLENLNTLVDIVRCKARKYCKIDPATVDRNFIQVTLLTRSGARAFSNESGVTAVIEAECQRLGSCQLQVVPISNLSFCEQVQVMSSTDVFITTHGAQLTNMLFMSPGGAVMEMLPKGWLEFAGIGQFIYKWLADWSRLYHQGVWRDTEGPDCPYPRSEELKCFLFHKDATVGLNETYLSSWTARVLADQRSRALHIAPGKAAACACETLDQQLAF